MSNLIFTVLDDKYIEESKNDKVYIVSNVNEYKEEIQSLLESKEMSFVEIKHQIESWGGTIDLVSLNILVKNYKKNFI